MMGHGVGTFLISAAAGYWVLTLAGTQKNRVRKLGEVLGLLIIIVSLAGTACKLYFLATGKSPVAIWCPAGKVFCPFPGAQATPASKSAP